MVNVVAVAMGGDDAGAPFSLLRVALCLSVSLRPGSCDCLFSCHLQYSFLNRMFCMLFFFVNGLRFDANLIFSVVHRLFVPLFLVDGFLSPFSFCRVFLVFSVSVGGDRETACAVERDAIVLVESCGVMSSVVVVRIAK